MVICIRRLLLVVGRGESECEYDLACWFYKSRIRGRESKSDPELCCRGRVVRESESKCVGEAIVLGYPELLCVRRCEFDRGSVCGSE